MATLWPHEYSRRTAARVPGQPDLYANDRELLGLAQVVDVPDTFSSAERRRAETLAADPRIRIALDTPDAGFTQVLAAGPELVRWWENAPDPYGKAVITAALDARRVGAHAPLSRDLLAAAAPAYLTSAQQATAPTDWLDQALTYATTPLRGATATLCQVAAGMGSIAGYTAADYLHQHAHRVRRTTPLPAAAWQALVDHHHPDDATTLADNAERRGQYGQAEILYRYAADAGSEFAAIHLAGLLAEQGQVKELRTRADAGDRFAAVRLASLLAEQGQLDELLNTWADADYTSTAVRLILVLVERAQLDELRTFAGTWIKAQVTLAGGRLVDLLVKRGDVDEALTILRTRADTDDASAGWLAELLVERGEAEELRTRADTGHPYAAVRLADLLAKQGKTEEALTVLRRRADDINPEVEPLADLLVKWGRVDEAVAFLRTRADADDWVAAYQLATLLAKQGRLDELEAEMHAGTLGAAKRLLKA